MNKRLNFAAQKDILRDFSLKRKLIIAFIAAIVAILGTMGTIITINEIYSARKIFISDSEGIMRTVGKNSAAALMFDNTKDAEGTVRVLRVFPDVKHASITSLMGPFTQNITVTAPISHRPQPAGRKAATFFLPLRRNLFRILPWITKRSGRSTWSAI